VELQITGKNLELSEEIRRYAQKKIGKLNRYLPSITDSKVEITEEKTKSPQHRFVVQVTINSKGTLLRGEERAEDLHTAIDNVASVMNHQIERYKGKLYKRGKKTSRLKGELATQLSETEGLPEIVKAKRFVVKPMFEEEAAKQMELLGHDFFLFAHAATGKLNLLYRRQDGNYGLIEAEME